MYTHAFTKKSPRLYKSYLVENLPFFTSIFTILDSKEGLKSYLSFYLSIISNLKTLILIHADNVL
jgi:hypothetical protein